MKPILKLPEGELYRAPALRVLAHLEESGRQVDHVVTDPPYSPHVHANVGSLSGSKVEQHKNLGFASMTPRERILLAHGFAKVSKRWVVVFCDLESAMGWAGALTSAGLDYVRTCWWVKRGGTPQLSGDRPAVPGEVFVLAHKKGRKRWNGGGKAGVYDFRIAAPCQNRHPTEKPIHLMSAILSDFTNKGDLIFDPFAGSGTTLRAAKDLGRTFVGAEIDKAWCARITDRLKQGVLAL